jgi:hypothetical protein
MAFLNPLIPSGFSTTKVFQEFVDVNVGNDTFSDLDTLSILQELISNT